MTSQSSFMVVARIDPKTMGGLRALLDTMNFAPGRVNPANSVIPFAELENLHFARIVILDDQTLDDIRLYGLPRQEYPVYLALLCDFDGGTAEFLNDLAMRAGPGLRRIFAHCDGFTAATDLLQWMRDHRQPAVATYVNWRGRSMKQVREEADLRQAIGNYLRSNAAALADQSSVQVHAHLRKFVEAETAAGRLTLSPQPPTPWGMKIANVAHLIGVGLLNLLLLPLMVLLLLFRIRPLETRDPEFAPRPDPEHVKQLAILEDYGVTNQFSALGSLKPGLARRWMLTFILGVIDWTARHLYTKGRLARVRTIHFAQWIFLDDKKRVFFASNYDGSLDGYMDDFINKVSFGLNVVFCNGIGYPTTNWLVADGAKDEQKFKYFIRRHQLPTQVWYNAHPGMTAADLERNSRIREGLMAPAVSGDAAREWVQLL
jgi:hypothetical protein